jgi:hypothetical protein
MILDIINAPWFTPNFPLTSSSARKKFNNIFVTSGMCPHPQVPDGIYPIRYNQIQIVVRNGNQRSLKIGTNQQIQGLHGHTLNFIQSHLQKHNHSDPLCSHIEQWHFISKTHIRNIALKDRNNQYNEVSFNTESTSDFVKVRCNVCQCPLRQHWSDKLDNDTNFCDCPEEAPFTKETDNGTQNDHFSSDSDERRRKCARCWKRARCYCPRSSDSSN